VVETTSQPEYHHLWPASWRSRRGDGLLLAAQRGRAPAAAGLSESRFVDRAGELRTGVGRREQLVPVAGRRPAGPALRHLQQLREPTCSASPPADARSRRRSRLRPSRA